MHAFHPVVGFSQPASVYCVFIMYIRYNRQMGRKEKKKAGRNANIVEKWSVSFCASQSWFHPSSRVAVSQADNEAIVGVAAVSWPMGAVLCALVKVSALCFAWSLLVVITSSTGTVLLYYLIKESSLHRKEQGCSSRKAAIWRVGRTQQILGTSCQSPDSCHFRDVRKSLGNPCGAFGDCRDVKEEPLWSQATSKMTREAKLHRNVKCSLTSGLGVSLKRH